MALSMSRLEREEFLADLHVGVMGVNEPGRAPLTVPVWYSYRPGGLVSVITGDGSQKARRVAEAGRFSLCAQTETAPYRYVSVEGPVVATDRPVDPGERRAVAYRYLGPEIGDLYLAATAERAAENCVIRMAPEHWRTADFAKELG
ncbi:MAG TPA: pyridoxamine 5'-phosphate oxidase family protein [Acidimicrobiales bacterium]|nr:pyridoxamine 5'-phosphate oxidase family protein [Acidimicrobiales bacterium]